MFRVQSAVLKIPAYTTKYCICMHILNEIQCTNNFHAMLRMALSLEDQAENMVPKQNMAPKQNMVPKHIQPFTLLVTID